PSRSTRFPYTTLFRAGQDRETVEIALTSFGPLGGTAEVRTRGVPVRRVGEQLVTAVFDLLLAQYGVFRPGLPGDWPQGYEDPTEPYPPAWQGAVTGVAG